MPPRIPGDRGAESFNYYQGSDPDVEDPELDFDEVGEPEEEAVSQEPMQMEAVAMESDGRDAEMDTIAGDLFSDSGQNLRRLHVLFAIVMKPDGFNLRGETVQADGSGRLYHLELHEECEGPLDTLASVVSYEEQAKMHPTIRRGNGMGMEVEINFTRFSQLERQDTNIGSSLLFTLRLANPGETETELEVGASNDEGAVRDADGDGRLIPVHQLV